MNISLINPPSPFLIEQKSFPPLGILYIASILENNGDTVKIIDLSGKENDIENELKHCSNCYSDLYFITSTTPQYYYAKIIKDILRNINPICRIVIGGAHPSSEPEKCIKDGFDIVVVGEGENAAVDISNNIVENGIISLPYIKDIDTIPFPARHLIDIHAYGYDIEGKKATTMITSRGCPYQCAFCSKDVWKKEVRLHSPEYVVREIEDIQQKFGINNILFLDDSFTSNKNRLLSILELVKPLNINFRCYINSKGMTYEILKKMYDAGCIEVGIGIESGSQKILDIANKRSNVEDNLRLIKMCKDIGIITNTFIMIGLPGETHETVMQTKKWMETALPDKFGFNIFVPYVGTPISNNPKKYDITLYNMSDIKGWAKGRIGEYECFVSTSELSREEILRLFNELFIYYSNITKWKPGVGRQ